MVEMWCIRMWGSARRLSFNVTVRGPLIGSRTLSGRQWLPSILRQYSLIGRLVAWLPIGRWAGSCSTPNCNTPYCLWAYQVSRERSRRVSHRVEKLMVLVNSGLKRWQIAAENAFADCAIFLDENLLLFEQNNKKKPLVIQSKLL